ATRRDRPDLARWRLAPADRLRRVARPVPVPRPRASPRPAHRGPSDEGDRGMNIPRGIYRFLYDVIIGDDWKIAATVITAVTIGLLLLGAGLPTTAVMITTAGLVGAAFTIALP